MFKFVPILLAGCLVMLTSCSGGGSTLPPASSPPTTPAVALSAHEENAVAFSPGDSEPLIAMVTNRPLTPSEIAHEAIEAADLGSPHRIVFDHARSRRGTMNVVAGGNGEAVGMWTTSTFTAQGSVVNMGVQPNYYVKTGGNFYHTHQFVNNQCFEYGINYSATAPTLFVYNWCTGGNTPQGFVNRGLAGYPGGVLNQWSATGNGWMIAWDSTFQIDKIALEEVQRSDGWHLLGYNWTTKRYYDLMNGLGVTGTKAQCCGWDVFESHNAPGAACNFDPSFPIGTHLLYDLKKQVLINKRWQTLDNVPSGGFTYGTMIDCADITGKIDPGYASPYFSGQYFPQPTSTRYAGDWWMTQR